MFDVLIGNMDMFDKTELQFLGLTLLVMVLLLNPYQWALFTVFIILPALSMVALTAICVLVDSIVENLKKWER